MKHPFPSPEIQVVHIKDEHPNTDLVSRWRHKSKFESGAEGSFLVLGYLVPAMLLLVCSRENRVHDWRRRSCTSNMRP